ncbi:MAG TPA: hypothetical protein PKX56_02365 [Marmoricola sp.]|nr:hypothetical protein [Marmoricola sp.]
MLIKFCAQLSLAIAFLALSGCGAPEPLTAKQVEQALLTKTNIGPTFISGESEPLTTKLGCIEEMSNFSGAADVKPAAHSAVQFGNDSLSGLPAVRVEVRSYADRDQAKAVMAAIREQAKRCTEVAIEGQTSRFDMKVQHDEKRRLRDSEAQLNTTGLGEVSSTKGLKMPTGLWLTHAIKDNNLLAVTYLNYSATDEPVARTITKAAWQRLQAVANGEKPDTGRVQLPQTSTE